MTYDWNTHAITHIIQASKILKAAILPLQEIPNALMKADDPFPKCIHPVH